MENADPTIDRESNATEQIEREREIKARLINTFFITRMKGMKLSE